MKKLLLHWTQPYLTPTFWLSLPIGMISVFLLALVCERLWTFRRKNLRPPAVEEELRNLKQGLIPDRAMVVKVVKRHPGPLARLLDEALRHAGRDHAQVEAALQATARRELARLALWNDPLALAGRLGPLLGLLGTVLLLILEPPAAVDGAGPRPPAVLGGLGHGLYPMSAGVVIAILGESLCGFFSIRLKKYRIFLDQQLAGLAERIALLPSDQPVFPGQSTTAGGRGPCRCDVSIARDAVNGHQATVRSLPHTPVPDEID